MKEPRPQLGPIDNVSAQPLYLQIKTMLAQRILDGNYAPHERLPSESELMKVFGVSRITVRQALRDLHADGLVFSVQGKGTFVAKPKAIQDVQRLQGFGETMIPQGYEASTRVIGLQEIRPSQNVAEALHIKQSEMVVEIKRVRFCNREPISIDQSFYPIDIGRRLSGRDLTQDIFPMLENEFDIVLDHADLRIEATLADDEQAGHLNCDIGAPVLLIQRLVLDDQGNRIAFEFLSHRGDAFQYHLRADRR
jgi:GntR family transcriptional regulator